MVAKSMNGLRELGLSDVEAGVYLYLLRNGSRYANQIQTALEIQKVPTYRALNALKAKGLVDSIGETRNQQFVAQPIETVLEEYDRRQQQLTLGRLDVEALARDLADHRHELYKERKVQVYEGIEGYRLWHEERMHGAVERIREFGQPEFVHQFFDPDQLSEYMLAYIDRRVGRGISIESILDNSSPLQEFDRTDDALLKEVRVMDIPPTVEGFLSTFGTRFGFYTRHGDQSLGVIIDDPQMTAMMNLFFDAMWAQADEI